MKKSVVLFVVAIATVFSSFSQTDLYHGFISGMSKAQFAAHAKEMEAAYLMTIISYGDEHMYKVRLNDGKFVMTPKFNNGKLYELSFVDATEYTVSQMDHITLDNLNAEIVFIRKFGNVKSEENYSFSKTQHDKIQRLAVWEVGTITVVNEAMAYSASTAVFIATITDDKYAPKQ